MKRLGTAGLIMIVLFMMCAPLSAADNNAITSFFDYLQGPEMYTVLQDTHKIVGYTSATLGLATCILNPAFVEKDIHETLGMAAALSSGFNIGVGLLNYSDRIFTPKGEKPQMSDLLHATMSIVGSILMITATGLADDDGFGQNLAHATLGIAGASLMASAIFFQW